MRERQGRGTAIFRGEWAVAELDSFSQPGQGFVTC